MSKDRFTASSYHRMSAAEKQAASLSAVRELPVSCLRCDTQLMPVDLQGHEARCPGPREPGPGSRWLTWRQAIALVPEKTLRRWVKAKHVQKKGGRGDQLYLERDIRKRLHLRRIVSRR